MLSGIKHCHFDFNKSKNNLLTPAVLADCFFLFIQTKMKMVKDLNVESII